MLPWWCSYGDFDDGGDSFVKDERVAHLFPVVLCFYSHLFFMFSLSLFASFSSLSFGLGGFKYSATLVSHGDFFAHQ